MCRPVLTADLGAWTLLELAHWPVTTVRAIVGWMRPIDEMPQRSATHVLDDAAVLAFRNAVSRARCFIIQSLDQKDYGSDIQLEALDGGNPTNFRLHVQLKGTSVVPNADSSISISDVNRSNLNYLLNTPEAIYVGFHEPSQRLFVRRVEDIYAGYERRSGSWQKQKTVTIRFKSDLFDDAFQQRLRDKVLAAHRLDRDERVDWAIVNPGGIRSLLVKAPLSIKVPSEVEQANHVLQELYAEGEDSTISHHYSQFAAVLRHRRGVMIPAHMAEINLGMNTKRGNRDRIEEAVAAFGDLIATSKGSLLNFRYCLANGLFALGRTEEAVAAYKMALDETTHPKFSEIAPQCFMNLGSALEQLGEVTAKEAYEKALAIDPDLAEARFALAQWHGRNSAYDQALAMLDGITRRKASCVDRNTIQGWKAHYLCLAGLVEEGIGELLLLIGSADTIPWIWSWSANLVARFGRGSRKTSDMALRFWREFLREHPHDRQAKRQRLLCLWVLRQTFVDEQRADGARTCRDGRNEVGYPEFRDAAIALMVNDDERAFWWDRIGHWAQADGNWVAAEAAYREAYALNPNEHGYCLGTALNFLDRYDEAVPLLDSAARAQDDSIGWHQLGVAHAGRKDWIAAVAAYQRAIELDPDEPLPAFNLGGAYWNAGDQTAARDAWQRAMTLFPEHALMADVRRLLEDLR